MLNISMNTLSEISDLNSQNDEIKISSQTKKNVEMFIDNLWEDVLVRLLSEKLSDSIILDNSQETTFRPETNNFIGRITFQNKEYHFDEIPKPKNKVYIRGPIFSGKTEFLRCIHENQPALWNFEKILFLDLSQELPKMNSENLESTDSLILIDNLEHLGQLENLGIESKYSFTILIVEKNESSTLFFDDSKNDHDFYIAPVNDEDIKDHGEAFLKLAKLKNYGLIKHLAGSLPIEIIENSEGKPAIEMLEDFRNYLREMNFESDEIFIQLDKIFKVDSERESSTGSFLSVKKNSSGTELVIETNDFPDNIDLKKFGEIHMQDLKSNGNNSLTVHIDIGNIGKNENFEKFSSVLDFFYTFVYKEIKFKILPYGGVDSEVQDVEKIFEKITFWTGSLLADCKQLVFEDFYYFSKNFSEAWRIVKVDESFNHFLTSDLLLKIFNNREYSRKLVLKFNYSSMKGLNENELEHVISDVSCLLQKLKNITGISIEYVNDMLTNPGDYLINTFTNDLVMTISEPIKDVQLKMESFILKLCIFPTNEESIKRLLNLIDSSTTLREVTIHFSESSPMSSDRDLDYFLNVFGFLMMCSQTLEELHITIPAKMSLDEINRFIDCSFASGSLKRCQLALVYGQGSFTKGYIEQLKNTFIFSKTMKPINVLPRNPLFKFTIYLNTGIPESDFDKELIPSLNAVVNVDYSGRLEFRVQ